MLRKKTFTFLTILSPRIKTVSFELEDDVLLLLLSILSWLLFIFCLLLLLLSRLSSSSFVFFFFFLVITFLCSKGLLLSLSFSWSFSLVSTKLSSTVLSNRLSRLLLKLLFCASSEIGELLSPLSLTFLEGLWHSKDWIIEFFVAGLWN